jgi:hypothetical protein
MAITACGPVMGSLRTVSPNKPLFFKTYPVGGIVLLATEKELRQPLLSLCSESALGFRDQ